MKGNNEFVYFLVGGLIIIAVLMAFLGNTVYKFDDSKKPQEPGIIEAVKTFSIPNWCASNLIDRRTTELVSRDVFSGLLFGENKVVYNLSKSALQDVEINFVVTDTNDLGDMLITVNGKLLEKRRFPAGTYSINVPAEMIEDHMLIEIVAESSYWKIWAPNIYRISDASATFTSYFEESAQYKFYLGEEYINLEFAKVDLVLEDNVGTLIVDINGRTIWDSPVADMQSIRLDKADLRLGDNIIKFRSEKDSLFCGEGTIVVIFLTLYPELINQTGIVTATQPLVGVNTQFVYP